MSERASERPKLNLKMVSCVCVIVIVIVCRERKLPPPTLTNWPTLKICFELAADCSPTKVIERLPACLLAGSLANADWNWDSLVRIATFAHTHNSRSRSLSSFDVRASEKIIFSA